MLSLGVEIFSFLEKNYITKRLGASYQDLDLKGKNRGNIL